MLQNVAEISSQLPARKPDKPRSAVHRSSSERHLPRPCRQRLPWLPVHEMTDSSYRATARHSDSSFCGFGPHGTGIPLGEPPPIMRFFLVRRNSVLRNQRETERRALPRLTPCPAIIPQTHCRTFGCQPVVPHLPSIRFMDTISMLIYTGIATTK